jgi:hypothetical protein
MIVGLLALFVALTGVGVAATGGNFILGKSNSATDPTSLNLTSTIGSTTALHVSNASQTPGSTALALKVPSSHPPMTVSSSTKVTNLNADKLDDFDATHFLSATGTATNSTHLAGHPATYFLHPGFVVTTPVGQGVVLPGDGSLHVATQLALPPGKYIVTGKTGVDVTNSTPVSRVACWLDDSGNSSSAAGFDNTTISVSADRQGALLTTGAAEIQSQGGGIMMKCAATRGDATLYTSTITAIGVSTLTRSGG